MLIDTHCHLDWESYKEDFDAVLQRAHDQNIQNIITIGVTPQNNIDTRELITKYPIIYRCIGIHPDFVIDEKFDAKQISTYAQQLEEELNFPKTVGVGECGLDYYCFQDEPSEKKEILKKEQDQLFRMQIKLAFKYNLPLSLHVRDVGEDAYFDTIAILKDEMHNAQKDTIKGVLHCVSGPPQYIHEMIKLGFSISFAGNLTYKNALNLHKLAQVTPLELIVLETDGPFLSPVPYRGKRNESSYMLETAKKLAELQGTSLENVAFQTTLNARQLFNCK